MMPDIRNMATPESRAFWEHVERVATQVRDNEQPWERKAREAREEFDRTHTYVTCPDCDGRGYRSWVNQLGCIPCAGQGGWYEAKQEQEQEHLQVTTR